MAKPDNEPLYNHYMPQVRESSPRGDWVSDIFSRLLRDRIIFLYGAIDDLVANLVISQLLFLEKEDPTKDIDLYVNSPGGHVTAGLAIYDTMQMIQPDVSTICVGLAASMGSVLLCAGAPGKRYALPNSEIMIHQPLGGFQGQATDIEIHARHILKTRERLYKIYMQHTGQPLERIERDAERDNFLDAEEAKTYGLIDEVFTRESRGDDYRKAMLLNNTSPRLGDGGGSSSGSGGAAPLGASPDNRTPQSAPLPREK